MQTLPSAFEQRMVEVLGSRQRLDELLEATSQRALRVNRLKTTPEELAQRLEALGIRTEPIGWAEDAMFAHDPDQRKLGALWEHRSGMFFLQDPASTLPVQALDPQPGEAVLDLCAAPGSKTTHIAERLDQQGLVVANDRQPGRVNNLISNLDQTGALTAVATQFDGCRLSWPITFDRVLVDAPCTNLGSMHADWEPVKRYDVQRVRRLVGTQHALLTTAFHAVREGGRIVYSTCTIEPKENEGVVDWFLNSFPVAIEPFEIDVGEPAMAAVAGDRYDGDVEAARRVWAGQAGTESFFVAVFTKTGDADDVRGDDAVGAEALRAPMGKGLAFQPAPDATLAQIRQAYGLEGTALDEAHALATANKVYACTVPDEPLDELLSLGVKRAGIYLARPEDRGHRLSFPATALLGEHAKHRIELSARKARRWLAGEAVEVPASRSPEWRIVTCQGEALGCARPFGEELPCFVPKRYRSPSPEADVLGFLPA